MKSLFCFFFTLCLPPIAYPQSARALNFQIGYGYFEGAQLGASYKLKERQQWLSVFLGYDPGIYLAQKTKTIGMSYEYAILRKRVNASNEPKWALAGKLFFWDFEDEFYRFQTLCINPAIRKRIELGKKFKANVDIGPLFNIVLFNQRKTFKEVGWPYYFMPNARVLFSF